MRSTPPGFSSSQHRPPARPDDAGRGQAAQAGELHPAARAARVHHPHRSAAAAPITRAQRPRPRPPHSLTRTRETQARTPPSHEKFWVGGKGSGRCRATTPLELDRAWQPLISKWRSAQLPTLLSESALGGVGSALRLRTSHSLTIPNRRSEKQTIISCPAAPLVVVLALHVKSKIILYLVRIVR